MGNARFLITHSCSSHLYYLLSCKILRVEEMMNFEERKFTDVFDFGDRKIWFLGNYGLHRSDGPAIECANGDKFWFNKGNLHRKNGSAIEWADGNEGGLLKVKG